MSEPHSGRGAIFVALIVAFSGWVTAAFSNCEKLSLPICKSEAPIANPSSPGLESDLRKAREEIAALEKRVADVQRKEDPNNTNLVSDLRKARVEIAALEKRVAELQRKEDADKTKLISDLEKARAEITALEKRIVELQITHPLVEATKDDLEKDPTFTREQRLIARLHNTTWACTPAEVCSGTKEDPRIQLMVEITDQTGAKRVGRLVGQSQIAFDDRQENETYTVTVKEDGSEVRWKNKRSGETAIYKRK